MLVRKYDLLLYSMMYLLNIAYRNLPTAIRYFFYSNRYYCSAIINGIYLRGSGCSSARLLSSSSSSSIYPISFWREDRRRKYVNSSNLRCCSRFENGQIIFIITHSIYPDSNGYLGDLLFSPFPILRRGKIDSKYSLHFVYSLTGPSGERV